MILSELCIITTHFTPDYRLHIYVHFYTYIQGAVPPATLVHNEEWNGMTDAVNCPTF